MLGILYSWELDMAAFLTWQRVVAAQGGLLYGDTEIDEDVMTYFQERKLEKLATFSKYKDRLSSVKLILFSGVV